MKKKLDGNPYIQMLISIFIELASDQAGSTQLKLQPWPLTRGFAYPLWFLIQLQESMLWPRFVLGLLTLTLLPLSRDSKLLHNVFLNRRFLLNFCLIYKNPKGTCKMIIFYNLLKRKQPTGKVTSNTASLFFKLCLYIFFLIF